MNTKLGAILLAVAGLIGCSTNRAPDVSTNIRNSLNQAGFKDVSVTQDRDRGVVTLTGNVKDEEARYRAGELAKTQAEGQVVANQIAVLPAGNESTAKTVNTDVDKGIEANLDAAMTANNFNGIHHSTKNGVVTLTGDVNSPDLRANAERVAAGVPFVQQVVNEINVKNQRATTSNGARGRS